MNNYVLNERGEPIAEPDIHRWGRWFETADDQRRVGADDVGDWHVSTVFLATDHNFGRGLPVLWETMIFGPEPWSDWQDRYTSRTDAEAGHKRVVDALKRGDQP